MTNLPFQWASLIPDYSEINGLQIFNNKNSYEKVFT
jgi:hypothetical protein